MEASLPEVECKDRSRNCLRMQATKRATSEPDKHRLEELVLQT
ncbi:hypothetical protein L249_3564, partial [Ophiocordyceps polyrhachis-furcata BCC 54312]